MNSEIGNREVIGDTDTRVSVERREQERMKGGSTDNSEFWAGRNHSTLSIIVPNILKDMRHSCPRV